MSTIRALGTILAITFLAIAAGPASATVCQVNCDREEPAGGGGGSGGGGGGGGGFTAPVTVEGTFRFEDRVQNAAGGEVKVLRPIAHTNVEIWAFAPRASGIWTWAHEADAKTDAGGSFSKQMPFQTSGIVYALRITATIDHVVKVWPNDGLHTVPFHVEPRNADGSNKHLTATSPGVSLKFDHDFTDDWSAQHFNLADAVLLGFDYAARRRDPSECTPTAFSPPPFVTSPCSEPVPQVNVQPTTWQVSSWFNAPFDTIVIRNADRFNDGVVLHEYAHWLQEQIGALPWIPSVHDGCEAKALVLGHDVHSPEHAWLEGFADYFAEAVRDSWPDDRTGGRSGAKPTAQRELLETPPQCTNPQLRRFADDEIERFVAAVLWDLRDAQNQNEPHDQLDDFGRQIFQIMDRELDIPPHAGPWPSFSSFRTAWLARPDSLSSAERSARLEVLVRALNVVTNTGGEVDPGYDGTDPGVPEPDPDVCRSKPNTAGC